LLQFLTPVGLSSEFGGIPAKAWARSAPLANIFGAHSETPTLKAIQLKVRAGADRHGAPVF